MSNKAYTLRRKEIAQKVAAHASGFEDAIPEDIDFDIADKAIALIDQLLDETD